MVGWRTKCLCGTAEPTTERRRRDRRQAGKEQERTMRFRGPPWIMPGARKGECRRIWQRGDLLLMLLWTDSCRDWWVRWGWESVTAHFKTRTHVARIKHGMSGRAWSRPSSLRAWSTRTRAHVIGRLVREVSLLQTRRILSYYL
jgi:hypothetical protein